MKTTMTMTLTESVQDVSALANTCDIQSGSQVGGKGLQARKERKERKEKLTKSVLKKHLKYIVPEIKLALIKEPGVKLHSIHGPQEIERLIEPMKFYPDFVPSVFMCPHGEKLHVAAPPYQTSRHIMSDPFSPFVQSSNFGDNLWIFHWIVG